MFIKQQRSRLNRWDCLFTCMVTKAIHLELVESLDSDTFINALQRLINRRGRPNTIVSDCGSNFKGTVRALKMELPGLNQEKIASFTLKHGWFLGITDSISEDINVQSHQGQSVD